MRTLTAPVAAYPESSAVSTCHPYPKTAVCVLAHMRPGDLGGAGYHLRQRRANHSPRHLPHTPLDHSFTPRASPYAAPVMGVGRWGRWSLPASHILEGQRWIAPEPQVLCPVRCTPWRRTWFPSARIPTAGACRPNIGGDEPL